ncbi:hypothetical protein M409DRAFT_65568 [Zasmidium cellare ATCC 36951]|uniref:Flavoprotein pyridine nucleotide cytochrome reductase-like FAD-binding domain-containing protein n=1 Tax=Zasmidium cellare ATCC 36951 TaxID=1080233 RepID=A0A6A6CR93_ZASCE|nr:uncharacterized protein M409DRAFT_65568 [Zasmidium cellare ATCC 36951]KAF2168006.1 hypothetical protein M409DRAFT_65568 [Zasmidium cellare ATCC 36951]
MKNPPTAQSRTLGLGKSMKMVAAGRVAVGSFCRHWDSLPSQSPSGEFAKYILVGKDPVSSTCAIFRLMPAGNVAIDLDDPDCERAITSLQFKQPQLQIARAYTCLPQQQGQHMDELRFLIRREQKGEVSNFLHRLPIGAEIEARGLHAEYIVPKDVKSVVFIAGGTGIAPALQVADILEGQADMHILWANRKREDCVGGHSDTKRISSGSWWSFSRTSPGADTKVANVQKSALVSVLEDLKDQATTPEAKRSQLLVDYYVDEEGALMKPQDVTKVIRSISTQENATVPGKKIVFVSGPEGFVNYWAGPKQWIGGREVQGPLKGVLSAMDLDDWEVVKL